MQPQAILLSPGPCTPNEAGICLDLIGAAAAARLPLFGVCLGHQSLGQAFGGTVVRAPQVMHGKTNAMTHDGTGIFAGLPSPFQATRYHSLIVREDDLPDCFAVNARSPDGVIMGMRHKRLPLHGVQFHPESIATEHGHAMLANFMTLAGMAIKPLVRAA
jgi:anthranilate synthase component 2